MQKNCREGKGQLFDYPEILNAIRGQFSPNQLSAYLNMDEDVLLNPENYVVLFHERFHYLESIFTSYGHLKWSSFRTITADIIDMWLSLAKETSSKKIPVAEYLKNPTKNDIKVLANVWMQDWIYQIFLLFEKGLYPESLKEVLNVQNEQLGPVFNLGVENYQIKGIDVLESFAKYQEAILGHLIGYKDFLEAIDVDRIGPEYYAALHYFIIKVGADRISEFPIACELSLTISHLPKPNDVNSILNFSIGYRFSVILEYISRHPELKNPDFHSNETFFEYADKVLVGCGFDTYKSNWAFAKKYAHQTNLTLANEMERAIKFKMENPWALSFPFRTLENFTSDEFNSFFPIFTITNDAVLYNLNGVSPSEVVFENHFQALSLQICGKMSNRCIYPNMLQCGFSYFGTNDCPHQLSGECDGHIDKKSVLPKLECDSFGDIKRGCTMDLILNEYGTSIKEIEIGNVNQKVEMSDIVNATKKLRETL